MPLTSAAFTVGAFGMIGLPPTAGFISKWQLGEGALASPHPWVLGVLVLSSLLNAAYFLPIVLRLWAPEPVQAEGRDRGRVHEPAPLVVPAMITAGFTLLVGLAASVPFAPLRVAEYIAEGVFR